jgi:glutathione S-transferase
MTATLFVIPASHPSAAARLMLERKGIEYRRIALLPVIHRGVLKAAGFGGVTVPALRLDGQRLQGSRTISRALDALQPEPPLFPRDRDAREAVERAEALGDEVYQPAGRRIAWAALRRDHSTIGTFLEGARLGIPTGLAARTSPPIVALASRLNRATDDAVRLDLERLPGWLERIEEWIGEGVLGGEEPNAADYQIATCTRLLMCQDDLRPVLEARPAGRHALEIVGDFPGRVPPVFPAGWLAPLERAPSPA